MSVSKFIQPQIRWALTLTLLFIFAAGVFLAFSYSRLPPQVPLFYSRPWGTAQLVPPLFLLMLPLFSLIILVVNLILSRFLIAYPFLISILFWTGTLFSFLSFLDLVKIITTII